MYVIFRFSLFLSLLFLLSIFFSFFLKDHEKDDSPLEKGKGEDFENDLEANSSAFEALERDFQDVNFLFSSFFFFLISSFFLFVRFFLS